MTAEGRVLHERADAGIPESREGMRVLRSVHVASDRLGVHGVALSLINRRQLAARDFEAQETGAVLLTEEARRTVLQAYHDRKRTELRHAWLDERMALGLVPQVQAQMLARHLRGDLDAYPAWIW